MTKQPSPWGQDLQRIGGLWGIGCVVALIWLLLDHQVPGWDQSNHRSYALNYWWALTHSAWWTADGWRELWMLSPKYPPVLYLTTAIGHLLVGPGVDQSLLANGFFELVLLIATYGLGRHLFNARIGLLAVGVCLLMPRLIQRALDYHLDCALAALVILTFWCLTVWRDAPTRLRQWLWIVGFGMSAGLALMTKQSALPFFVVPLAWVSVTTLYHRRWERLLQLLIGLGLALAVMLPWLSVNWFFQFSIWPDAIVSASQTEGDPTLNTWGAWLYYWRDLPKAISWPLLLVPLVGLGFWRVGFLPGRRTAFVMDGTATGRWWLLAYILGAYLLWSATVNKDPRYITPYLPAIAIFLGWGLACWWRRWPWVTVVTFGLSTLVALLSLFPIGGPPGAWLAQTIAPRSQLYPYRGPAYPHPELIDYIVNTRPYQLSTLGGIASTAIVNQHNISYYGKLRDYQVYGRQVGNRPSMVDKDLRSLSWFYNVRAPQAVWPPPGDRPEAQMIQQLETNPDFALERTWTLPDGSGDLYLYRRQQFPVTVTPLAATVCSATPRPRLNRVDIPSQVAPGQPIPVTYEWIGQWQQLHSGVVLLTWEPTDQGRTASDRNRVGRTVPNPWIHDHAIGLGTLRPHPIQANQTILSAAPDVDPQGCFQVTERTATLPPTDLLAGTYRLRGRHLADVADWTELPVPLVEVEVTAAAPSAIAAELDWVTQLREAAHYLPQGPDALDEVFDPIGRINVYDPIQAYTVQAEASLQQRWADSPENLGYGYGLVLAQILQLKVDPAIASLERLVAQDAENPYAHAYLGFVNLYALRPWAAQAALEPALALAPKSPEIRGLSALAKLLQGNLWGAWKQGQAAINLLQENG